MLKAFEFSVDRGYATTWKVRFKHALTPGLTHRPCRAEELNRVLAHLTCMPSHESRKLKAFDQLRTSIKSEGRQLYFLGSRF